MADPNGLPSTLQMARMAIPRPQFFVVVLIGAIILQHLIAGVRFQAAGDPLAQVLPRSALLVTAHPDDEAMFFGPTILALSAAGVKVSGLCLSTGNAKGLGVSRVEELYRSYNALGVPDDRVSYLEAAQLEDGMDTVWDPNYIASMLQIHVNSIPGKIDALISFDWRGVSEHPNHIAAYHGTSLLAHKQKLPFYVLPTFEIWEKYTSVPIAVWDSIAYSGYAPDPITDKVSTYEPAKELLVLASPQQYFATIRAMLQHKTQLEWYRYLYVIFSRYMFSNRLVLWDEGMEERARLADEEF